MPPGRRRSTLTGWGVARAICAPDMQRTEFSTGTAASSPRRNSTRSLHAVDKAARIQPRNIDRRVYPGSRIFRVIVSVDSASTIVVSFSPLRRSP
jgi:hypothetical protein